MSVSEVDKCYLCDLLGDFEEFQDIKKEFDAQHACWNNKSKYDKDNKENSKDKLKTRVLNSKSVRQDKPILKISDLNIDLTAKKNASAENVENENPVVVQNILKPISFGILEMEMSILSVWDQAKKQYDFS